MNASDSESFFRQEEHEGERKINTLRLGALALLCLNELLNYYVLGFVDVSFHRGVMPIVALYALCAFGCWWFVNKRGRYNRSIKYTSQSADVFFLTWVLWIGNGPSSALVTAYYLLIAFSSFRYNWKVTFASAVMSAAAFGSLQLYFAAARPQFSLPNYMVVIHALCMLLMGVIAAHVVAQLRALVTRFATAVKRQAKTESALSRYVSQPVAAQIMESDGLSVLAGRRCEAAILMADIRGFTPMAEKMDPVELMSLLNRYFALMIEVIFKYNGTLDKFIGDAILVVFGVPLPQREMELRAVRCAEEMQKALIAFNKAQRDSGGQELAAGISVHSGLVVAGNVGSEMRMEYTVLGDVVNLTQRMQSKAEAGRVIVSDAVFRKAGEDFSFRPLEPFSVKGRQEPVLAYELEQ